MKTEKRKRIRLASCCEFFVEYRNPNEKVHIADVSRDEDHVLCGRRRPLFYAPRQVYEDRICKQCMAAYRRRRAAEMKR
jgi:hypothetical protein